MTEKLCVSHFPLAWRGVEILHKRRTSEKLFKLGSILAALYSETATRATESTIEIFGINEPRVSD